MSLKLASGLPTG